MLIRAEDGDIYNLDYIYKWTCKFADGGYFVVAYLITPDVLTGRLVQEAAKLTLLKASEEDARNVLERIMEHSEGNLDLTQLPGIKV